MAKNPVVTAPQPGSKSTRTYMPVPGALAGLPQITA